MMRRSRGRNNGHGSNNPNSGSGGGNGGGGNNNQQRRSSVPNRHQVFDSNGPDVRIRGSAWQVYEKYQALARDAQAAGDRVKVENYLQHAEHYYRIILAVQEAMGEAMPQRPREEDMEDNAPAPRTEAEVVVPQDPSQMPQPSSEGYEALQPPEAAAVA